MEKEFKREKLFKQFHSNSNPFIIVTVPVDVTNIVNYCKKYKNFYATVGYLITKTANQMDAFKWRYENDEFHYYGNLLPSFAQKLSDDEIGYFDCEYREDYQEFIHFFNEIQNQFYKEGKSLSSPTNRAIWFSCIPWFSITSCIPPFDKNNTIPQFIWDKYEQKNGRYQFHLMILVHHGFADGYHISQFLELFQKEIENFSKIEKI